MFDQYGEMDHAQEYHSFTGKMTLLEAIKWLGADHVARIIENGFQEDIARRVHGAWHANLGKNHRAYCAVMQAGEGGTTQMLDTHFHQAIKAALA